MKLNFLAYSSKFFAVSVIVVVACSEYKPNSSAVAPHTNESISADNNDMSKTKVQELGDKVATWQIEQFGNLNYIPESQRENSENPRFWIQASFFIGLTRWIDKSESHRTKSLKGLVELVAKDEEYELQVNQAYYSDSHAISQTYLWLAEKYKDMEPAIPTKSTFDKILSSQLASRLNSVDEYQQQKEAHPKSTCQLLWCSANKLFRAPRAWLQMTKMTKEPKYFDFADSEFWKTVDLLFSEEYGLYYHDSCHISKKNALHGTRFSGRVNGSVFAALALIINDLEVAHPSYNRYVELYKKNAATFLELQTVDGHWSSSLLDSGEANVPEMAGTSFIVFGLAWGINNGVLSDPETKTLVKKGWEAMKRSIDESGRVNFVQHFHRESSVIQKSDSQLYGAGAVLLAASEIIAFE